MLARVYFSIAAASLVLIVLYSVWSYMKVRHAQEEDEAQDLQESFEASDRYAKHYQKVYRHKETWSCDQARYFPEDEEDDEWWKKG